MEEKLRTNTNKKINFNLTTTIRATTTLGPERCNVCSKNRLKCKLNGNCASNWSGGEARGAGVGRMAVWWACQLTQQKIARLSAHHPPPIAHTPSPKRMTTPRGGVPLLSNEKPTNEQKTQNFKSQNCMRGKNLIKKKKR